MLDTALEQETIGVYLFVCLSVCLSVSVGKRLL